MKNNDDDKPDESDSFEQSIEEQSIENPHGMPRKTIALETLARYSGSKVQDFQQFIVLSNFRWYLEEFSKRFSAPIISGRVMNVAHSQEQNMSIIDYRVGAPMAALVVDVLSYIHPEVILMLGLCGGLHRSQKIGDFLLPVAAIRDEGASLHYMPHQVPSLPAFMVQQYISQELIDRQLTFRTGVIHTTDYRMWEFDEKFRALLKKEKATAIDMECSAMFTTGFSHKVPVGALMLVSDLPMRSSGIKTEKSSRKVFNQFAKSHFDCGIHALQRMREAVVDSGINFRRFDF